MFSLIKYQMLKKGNQTTAVNVKLAKLFEDNLIPETAKPKDIYVQHEFDKFIDLPNFRNAYYKCKKRVPITGSVTDFELFFKPAIVLQYVQQARIIFSSEIV